MIYYYEIFGNICGSDIVGYNCTAYSLKKIKGEQITENIVLYKRFIVFKPPRIKPLRKL